MAFTINYDGTGIVAYANGQTTDTGGGSWGELGAGTVGDNPDVYLYGANSFGSKYASKEGRTYYQDDTTIDVTTTGDLIYMLVNIQSNGAFTLYNSGGTFIGPFNAIVGSSTANLSHWNIAAKGASNGWSGGWKAFVIDPTITTGTETEGTPDTTLVNTYGVWIDTDVSVRADSIFQSMIIAAKGIKFTGSPTTASGGWDELALWCTDYTNRAFPFLEVRGNTYFMKGGVLVGDGTTSTTFSAANNNIECEESSFYNGTAWVSSYPSTANHIATTANSSIDWTNVSISGYIDNKLSIDTSLGNASSFVGGNIKVLSTLVGKATDSYDGVVLGQYDARTLGAEGYLNCTFDGSSSLTLTATSDFANTNIVNGTSAVTSVITADISYVASNTFNSSGSNHAVELTSISGGTISWDTKLSGFDAGDASGGTTTPVTPTTTGNEAIYITATSATDITISVASGAGIPSIRVAASYTGNVYVVAGQVTFTLTVKDTAGIQIQGAMVYVLADVGGELAEGTTIIDKVLTDVNGQVSDTRSYTSNQPIVGRVRKSTTSPLYKTTAVVGTVSSTGGLDLTVQMIGDE